jgi:hypothetical protein
MASVSWAQMPQSKLQEPQTLHDKFMVFAVKSFGPRALVNPAFTAGIRMANPPNRYPREWRQGAEAFGRNYGNTLATHTAASTGRFLAAAALHEDLRYHPSSSSNVMVRTAHAIGYTFVDRSDSGRRQLAFANFAGAASGGFVGRLYLPPGFDDVSHAEARAATLFLSFAGQNVIREFSPELLRVARKLHVPRLELPIPEWWVKR